MGNKKKLVTLVLSFGFLGILQNLSLAGPAEPHQLYCYSIMVEENITLFPGCSLQGYDSRTGEIGFPIVIGTNSTENGSVYLSNRVLVDGDIAVGTGANLDAVVETKKNSIITGVVFNLAIPFQFIPITIPMFEGPDLDITAKGETIVIDASGNGDYANGRYDSITLSSKSNMPGKLQIAGDVVLHVTGDINMSRESEIEILEDSSLRIFLDGDLNAATINKSSMIPANFILYGTNQQSQIMLLKKDFFGIIYAPKGEVNVSRNTNVYGAIAAYDFEMKQDARFYYDLDLCALVPY